MIGVKPILPTDPAFRLPDCFADMARTVLRREFVPIRPGLLKIESDVVKARLTSCLPPEEAACYDFGRQMGLLTMKPTSEVRVLGVLGLDSNCKKSGRRIMPVFDGLLMMMSQFDSYRIKLLPEERESNGGGEYRLLTTLERIALLYFRFRPLVAPALLVRQFAALVLFCGTQDDVVKYFHSPVVVTILQCKYDDGKLDYEHPMLELFDEISRQPVWNSIISRENRKRIFATPQVRANHRDERKAAFKKLHQAFPHEIDDCLVLSDSLIAALAGAGPRVGGGTRLKVTAYIFHPYPFWSVELKLPQGSRIERYDSWANYTPPVEPDEGEAKRKKRARKQRGGRDGDDGEEEDSTVERLSDIDSENEDGGSGSDDWDSEDESDQTKEKKARSNKDADCDSDDDDEKTAARTGPSKKSKMRQRNAKFIREIRDEADIEQLKANYAHYCNTGNKHMRIHYYRCKETACEFSIRTDYRLNAGSGVPLALLYEKGEHNHDFTAGDENRPVVIEPQVVQKGRGRPPKPPRGPEHVAPQPPREAVKANEFSGKFLAKGQASISKFLKPLSKPPGASAGAEVGEEVESTADSSNQDPSLPGDEETEADINDEVASIAHTEGSTVVYTDDVKEEVASIAPTEGSTVVYTDDVKEEEREESLLESHNSQSVPTTSHASSPQSSSRRRIHARTMTLGGSASLHSSSHNNSDPDAIMVVELCVVCGNKASGRHYGAISCEGCKGFFIRSIRNKMSYVCRGSKNCSIAKSDHYRCPFCRLQKCYSMGMKSELMKAPKASTVVHTVDVKEEEASSEYEETD